MARFMFATQVWFASTLHPQGSTKFASKLVVAPALAQPITDVPMVWEKVAVHWAVSPDVQHPTNAPCDTNSLPHLLALTPSVARDSVVR